ncbi:TonB-dependent receptor [Flavobacterium algicola]|uniref:TonB-dependent receptor n=1 Tax=Flavobacterium algicola TaxID=556529 RepID=UPI001EFD00D3|nr:TonB-dependent receptor [Flavobacterium algicola]MCG9793193.1 TonB-dependent receptor [Flavobacterium algicola]
MKTIKDWLLSGLLFLVVATAFSQGKITGTITDAQGSLPGANVAVKGNATGVSADIDGKFSINTTVSSGELIISFLGYEPKSVKFSIANGATKNLGTVVLISNSNELDEIVVKSGVIDVAKARKTPVAVSTIKAIEIQEKLGTQEFPEILKNTPSVYVTKSGGGFGDSRINIRGFDQKNIAVMINGAPVNDMESGAVYWSNWAGLSDVTSAMQVQRGLGSSKLAIASVGGTINIITKSSDLKEGGSVSSGFGNANYFKVQGSYNTGVMENGLSASILLSATQGDGYIDGTEFEGQNYYIALGYKSKNDKHDIQFTFTGAPQWHNQRSTYVSIANYIKYGSDGEPNTRYNSDWGTLDGKEFNMKRNYYHKPVGSINWDYKINETTKLSTIVYGSWGRGAGGSGTGGIAGNNYVNDNLRTATGLVDYDKIQAYNSGLPVSINGQTKTRTMIDNQFQNSASTGTATNTTNGISQISSYNSHDWYGAIASLNKQLNKNLVLDFGVDARTYKGIHYQVLNNLLGGSVFIDSGNKNLPANQQITKTYSVSPSFNPFVSASADQKINFDYDGKVNWVGAFTQLEYSNDDLTAFVQAAISQQGFKKIDRFQYPEFNQGTTVANPDYDLRETDYKNITGGNVKGGANYNINENHNVFVNAGYYSKQPFFNSVYPNNKSKLNGNLTNEKITGFEAGYGFRNKSVNVNVNVYNTKWKDRYQRSTDGGTDNVGGYFDFSGITEIHSGIEVEGTVRVTDKLKINGMFSKGDWNYKGNSLSNRYDVSNNPIGGGTPTTLYLDKVKVGDAAQLTASLGAAYEVLTRLTVDANYNYNDDLYASISPNNFSSETNKGALELPSYGLMDAGLSYKLLVGKKKDDSVNFRLNVNNVLDKVYIAESKTNVFASDFVSGTSGATYASSGATYQGVATSNNVYFGFGRTWNFSLRYNF